MILDYNIAVDHEIKLLEEIIVGLGFDSDKAKLVDKTALDILANGIDQDNFKETFKV